MKRKIKVSDSQAEYQTPPGHDSTLDRMRERGIPLTRENYLDMAYGSENEYNESRKPENWGPELEAMLPREFQDWSKFPEELRDLFGC